MDGRRNQTPRKVNFTKGRTCKWVGSRPGGTGTGDEHVTQLLGRILI